MAYNVTQFRELIERVLRSRRELYSISAVNLLLGTGAQESACGTYLRQLGGGPAMGAFQMEPQTFDWLKVKYRDFYPEIMHAVFDRLEWDLWLAIFMARLRYRVDPKPLPAPSDLRALAHYYKRVFNTAAGAATPEQFISSWAQHIGPPP